MQQPWLVRVRARTVAISRLSMRDPTSMGTEGVVARQEQTHGLVQNRAPLCVQAHRTRAVDKAELASVIQDAATASSSIIDETMAMLNEQDTLDNVKAKLKPFNVDERRHDLRKLS